MPKEKSLTEAPAFWVIIFIGFTAQLILLLLILSENKLFFCFTETCLSNFSKIFSLNGTLLLATITILGFYATIFRSNQTKTQIELAIDQNYAKNYFDHKKEFKDWIANAIEGKNFKIESVDALYRNLYPENSFQKVVFVSPSAPIIINELKGLIELFSALKTEHSVNKNYYAPELFLGRLKEFANQNSIISNDEKIYTTKEPDVDLLNIALKLLWELCSIFEQIALRDGINSCYAHRYGNTASGFEHFYSELHLNNGDLD